MIDRLPVRLAVTVGLIVLAVGLVTLLGHFSKTVSTVEAPPKKPVPPAPIVSQVLPPAPAAQSFPVPAQSSPHETPPPPSVSNVLEAFPLFDQLLQRFCRKRIAEIESLDRIALGKRKEILISHNVQLSSSAPYTNSPMPPTPGRLSGA